MLFPLISPSFLTGATAASTSLVSVFQTSNRPATPSTASIGTTLATGGVAHTKTGWTQLFAAASVTSDVHRVFVYIYGTSLSATQTDCLIDIGVGGAGSETVLVPNILGGFKPTANVGGGCSWLVLPLMIPSGTRISFRAQSLQLTKTIGVSMQLIGYSARPAGTFTACDAVGVNTGTSQGTSVLAGDTGAYGSWTSIGSPTAREYGAVIPVIQGSMDADTALAAYEFQAGAASAVLSGSDRWRTFATAAEAVTNFEPGFSYFGTVAASTQLQMRGTCSTTAEAMDMALYGFYNS